MSDRHYAVEVEAVFVGNLPQVVGSSRDVIERSRPAATGVAQSPIFHIPRGDVNWRVARFLRVPNRDSESMQSG